ncbi:MAG: hypothetical protein KKA05_10605, partial [Alphaproteobacteria bacterium]|nr:hypothetical protein [Alphaproteobacteria bacterium]
MTSWLSDQADLILEHHYGGSEAASLVNHATGTTIASTVGTWTGGTGYQDVSNSGATPKKTNLGVYSTEDGDYTFTSVFDPNNNVGIIGSTGTNILLKSTARGYLNALPNAGETISINSQAITFVASGAAGFQVDIGLTPQATMASIVALINANPGTFALTALSAEDNATCHLKAITAGAATIPLSDTCSAFKFYPAGGFSIASATASGSNGEAVNLGLFFSGGNFQMRNSTTGSGGLPLIANPGTGFHYVVGRGRYRDFARLTIVAGGVIIADKTGAGAGRYRATTQFEKGVSTGSTGLGQSAFDSIRRRYIDNAQILLADAYSHKTHVERDSRTN